MTRHPNLATLIGSNILGGTTTPSSPVLVFHDTFTDTNGVLLENHTPVPVNTPATSWTKIKGAIDIQSNKATGKTAGSTPWELYTMSTGINNFILSATWTGGALSMERGWLIRRNASTGKFYVIDLQSTPQRINFWVYDSSLSLLSSWPQPIVNGGTPMSLWAWVMDDAISVRFGDYISSYAPTSGTLVSSAQTAGIWGVSNATSETIDDFKVYSCAGVTTLVCEGDSLTLGTGATNGLSYPSQLWTLRGGVMSDAPFNFGVSGQTIATSVTNVAKVDNLYNAANAKNVAILWSGINDVANGVAAATVYNNIASWCTGRKALGFKVVVCTLPACGTLTGAQETVRQTVNASIVSNAATIANGLADLAANSHFDAQADTADTTYYNADTVHLTNAGYGIVAGIISAAIP